MQRQVLGFLLRVLEEFLLDRLAGQARRTYRVELVTQDAHDLRGHGVVEGGDGLFHLAAVVLGHCALAQVLPGSAADFLDVGYEGSLCAHAVAPCPFHRLSEGAGVTVEPVSPTATPVLPHIFTGCFPHAGYPITRTSCSTLLHDEAGWEGRGALDQPLHRPSTRRPSAESQLAPEHADQPPCGQGMPARTHASKASTKSLCESGGMVRPAPGAHAHKTSGSVFMCSMTSSPVRRAPFRPGSFICSQISAFVLPSHNIDKGASCQLATPGTNPSAVFVA